MFVYNIITTYAWYTKLYLVYRVMFSTFYNGNDTIINHSITIDPYYETLLHSTKRASLLDGIFSALERATTALLSAQQQCFLKAQ